MQNGTKRFHHELDIINLLKTVRLHKLIYNSFLSQRQRILY